MEETAQNHSMRAEFSPRTKFAQAIELARNMETDEVQQRRRAQAYTKYKTAKNRQSILNLFGRTVNESVRAIEPQTLSTEIVEHIRSEYTVSGPVNQLRDYS